MNRFFLMALAAICGPLAEAQTARETIRAGDRLTPENTEFGVEDDGSADLLGREVKRTVYAGKNIDPANTRSPRLVQRNQSVEVRYLDSGLQISINARATGDAGAGETVEVMNVQTRKLITGIVTPEGWIIAQ